MTEWLASRCEAALAHARRPAPTRAKRCALAMGPECRDAAVLPDCATPLFRLGAKVPADLDHGRGDEPRNKRASPTIRAIGGLDTPGVRVYRLVGPISNGHRKSAPRWR
ncbi:hypothetical protein ACRAWD_03370 [Caulobacter segnis]